MESNSYEEARKLRVQENLKHLEGLGISKISKGLLEVAKSERKLMKCQTSPKPKTSLAIIEPRRSSRERKSITTYSDEMYHDDDIGLRSYRKRYSKSVSSKREYNGRIASYEEQVRAVKRAEGLQCNLKSNHPSFVKSMVRSHVSSCFWLGLPTKFCKDYLPPQESRMVLEDEKGLEYDTVYIARRTGLSGGWKGFAMDHDLEDGDILVFELTEPERFKIYIIKAIEEHIENESVTDADTEGPTSPAKKVEPVEDDGISVSKDSSAVTGVTRRSKRATRRIPLN